MTRLIAWCLSIFGGELVLSQATIDVAPEDNPTSEPEPDVFVLDRPATALGQNYPTPSDLALVAEVADTTLAFDFSTKAGLYARAGIAEYWVVDVTGRALTVHRDPAGGIYRSVVRYAADEYVAPLGRPDSPVVVSTLPPPLAP